MILFIVDVSVRIIHETQTKNEWKIKDKDYDSFMKKIENGEKIIYRFEFSKSIIEKLKANYKNIIVNEELIRI